jgi:hypothetical protein
MMWQSELDQSFERCIAHSGWDFVALGPSRVCFCKPLKGLLLSGVSAISMFDFETRPLSDKSSA